ncbi:nicotinate-nucleotide adenylyltransferase [Paenibacillus sp. JX-17]|uniref:Probable nicotinate-nucleotide adenylyltransferase n=1 Tax=Paenibacillus lacisoli TaxID=3064525 RepID=A0ABT9C8B3_9BACL|nr:nicotinate-nucleotide adenylyltransferase [Paenibacillus sp. JX-17]MDO7905507.1 nicotinate-nucleotide adenylyltransferase [Paenibacillus sp. JX-17]
MKVGLMGGTFDPIHMGHLLAAESARDTHDLDEVWFMPSHIPPHKHEAGATGEQRLDMTHAAVDSHPQFSVLDLEIKRGGVSYTINTIRELQQMYPEIRFYFIIGADMVNYLPKWEEIEELAQRLEFIGVERPGYKLQLQTLPDYLQDRVHLAEMPEMDVSSTSIRERAAEGRSIRYLVPDRVYEYIIGSGIYAIQQG